MDIKTAGKILFNVLVVKLKLSLNMTLLTKLKYKIVNLFFHFAKKYIRFIAC